MDGYGPSTYGDGFADVYDDWYGDVSDAGATVERVAALATGSGTHRVLELGGGSGRLALSLAAAGIPTWTVDASLAMLRRLRGKQGGEAVHVVVGDMAALPLSPRARFGVVLCAFNTLFNLTTVEAQRRCLADAAARLVPGRGRLVIESFIAPAREEGDVAVSAVEPRHIGLDEVVLTVSRLDPTNHTITGQHVQITEAGIRLRPWMLRYLSPEELDGMAAEAGLRLVDRHGGWRAEPFTAESATHVSTYALTPRG